MMKGKQIADNAKQFYSQYDTKEYAFIYENVLWTLKSHIKHFKPI